MDSNYISIDIIRFKNVIKNLFHVIQDDGFICGGFARVCISPKDDWIPCSDIDIYCKNIEVFERIKERFIKSYYTPTRESDIAITMKQAFKYKGMGLWILCFQ